MSFKPKRETIALPKSALAPIIPVHLALPLLNEATKPIRATIPITEDNMFPTLLYGSIITIEQLQDHSQIEPGQLYYIVDGNMRGFLRRVSLHSNEDFLRLYSDNPDKYRWPAHLLRISSIRATFRVLY